MPSVGIATGAGRGMGLACASRMTELVDVLLLVDIDEPSVRAAAQALPRPVDARVEAVALDVTDPAALQELAAQVFDAGTLRAISHAAGISPSMADWRRVVAVD